MWITPCKRSAARGKAIYALHRLRVELLRSSCSCRCSYPELRYACMGLSTSTAMLFEAALGIPADMLIGMQTDYNMRLTKQDSKLMTRLNEIRKIAVVLV